MKGIKFIAAGLSALMCFPLFAACGEQTETVYQAATELSYYDGTHYEELADPYKSYYNGELWRRNSSDLSGADPLVLDNTSRDGYYYAYVTGLTYSRSKDLVTWESGGISYPFRKSCRVPMPCGRPKSFTMKRTSFIMRFSP